MPQPRSEPTHEYAHFPASRTRGNFRRCQSPSGLAVSVDRQLPSLIETYKYFHRAPELSHHEEKTAAFLAAELRKLGYTVTEHVGKYEDGSQAHGIVAILQNGSGPRLLIRTDMDALPVEEKTGLEYASTVRATNAQGQDVCVMHACGHDIHMTVLLGTARELAERKSQWHGTVMLIGQPSEEAIDGARVFAPVYAPAIKTGVTAMTAMSFTC